ncbi:MAG: cation-translocating P-type ATPase [Fimbriimonadaceae bacterium]|nr:cation-translocating P-type ATPase [Fimbriimonadaceae bacterium]
MDVIERAVQIVLTAICGLLTVVSWVVPHPALPYWAVLAGSYFAARAGWRAVQDREIDVNVLMIAAAVGSVAIGHPGEAAVLLFLFSLSSTLEAFALGRTKSAIEGLVKLRPESTLLVADDGDKSVLVKDLKVGDMVRVLPFEHVPVDGEIFSGRTNIDQVAMTGESVPVAKAAGDMVLAGTQNMEGMVVVKVTKAAGDTTLEKIVDLVRDAQENKASGERISQWFGKRYTLFVVGAFLLSLALRLAFRQPANDALYASFTLLVALSPCALVISSPATTLSALAWAARRGLLVRGGEAVEAAGQVDTLCVDKTGTLTVGRFTLNEICVCEDAPALVAAGGTACHSEEACWARGVKAMSSEAVAILRAAAAAEQYATHPIAEAIVAAAREQGVDVPEATDQEVVPGYGVRAVVEGQEIVIGQRAFFDAEGGLPPGFAAHAAELQHKGMTVAVLKYAGHFAALGLGDSLRPEAHDALGQLRALGLEKVYLLTGDTPETARAVAGELQIDEVHAGLLPQDKEQVLAGLAKEGRQVLFVGDGVNDAPSLAAARLGVAMGGLGSDIALNAADVVIMQDRLDRLAELVRLGRKANRVIRANLTVAGGMVVVLTFGSLLVEAAFPQARNAILPWAVVGHEGTTVLVILNGIRLLKGP